MRSAVLRGREHTRFGAVATIAEGPAAIGLSRGGAGKPYAHAEPNEDVAAFACGPGGVLLAVADGHGGCLAAEAAIEHLLCTRGPAWTAERGPVVGLAWESDVREALAGVHDEVVARATRAGRDATRTTLALALVRPADDLLAFASVGDSHVFHAGAAETVELGAVEETGMIFLGRPDETPASLRDKCVVGSEVLGATRAVVLVTDGISEKGIGVDVPETTVAETVARAADGAADLRPLEVARGVVQAAVEAHRGRGAGDNVASAVWFVTAG
jgi:serine/threonine protein phosphatase PrpC